MPIHSILALTDFSTPAEHALDRAALLAARHRARLRILYADEVPSLKFSDPFARLQQRARQLARRHGIAAEALAHSGDMLHAIVQHAARADLLVLDPRQHRAKPTFWRGTTLDQLMRRCPCPVLVVKQAPSGPYGHMLVAVDFTPESSKLVRYASGFEGDSALELFHAFNSFNEPGVRSDGGSAAAMEAYRQVGPSGSQRPPGSVFRLLGQRCASCERTSMRTFGSTSSGDCSFCRPTRCPVCGKSSTAAAPTPATFLKGRPAQSFRPARTLPHLAALGHRRAAASDV